jgi:hypothetical protein
VISISDVIVTGTVVSVEDSSIFANDGQLEGKLQVYTVEVDSVLKGDVPGRKLTYFTATGGSGIDWHTWSIDRPATGERWYIFLKNAQPGLVLCAGVNGCFRIEDNRLLRFGNVPYSYTKLSVDEKVKREVRSNEK